MISQTLRRKNSVNDAKLCFGVKNPREEGKGLLEKGKKLDMRVHDRKRASTSKDRDRRLGVAERE